LLSGIGWSLVTVGCGGSAVRGTAIATADTGNGPPGAAGANEAQACHAVPPDAPCPPNVVRDRSWDFCPFPRRADVAGIVDARVLLDVHVTGSGLPQSVAVLEDPGYDFGRAGAICAFMHGYVPAHYADGRTAPGSMKLRIHFSRSAR
jgi:hypothetical protein